jgi:hypothetical protein
MTRGQILAAPRIVQCRQFARFGRHRWIRVVNDSDSGDHSYGGEESGIRWSCEIVCDESLTVRRVHHPSQEPIYL